MTAIHGDFTNRVALVTGGTSGIGRATAIAFARAGARVAILARDAEKGASTRDAIAREGAPALFVQADVRDEASVASAVAHTVDRFGRLDFGVNCAGAGGDMLPLETTRQDVWDDVMTVNARGVWLAMRYEIGAMLKSGGGAIVNVSSIYGVVGKTAHHAYVASKHAILGMTRSVALEYATRGVRVNALCPGLTRTESMDTAEAAAPALVHDLVAQHPMARMATVDEVAAAALWLCSAGAGFITGAALPVDGGFLAA